MKNFYVLKILTYRIFSSLLLFFCFLSTVNGQNYPPQEQLSNVTYQNYQTPQNDLPEYLEPFTESLSGSIVTRIADRDVFGTSSNRIRHNYSLDQAWNSDGSLIKLSGYPAAIIDAETFEFLYWSNIPSYGRWSNTQPNIIYGSSGNRFVSHDINSNSTTTLRTFSEFQSIDFGYGKGNQDNNDRYVGLIGQNGPSRTLIVYDIQNNEIVSTKLLSSSNIKWFTVSQSGDYAVLGWNSDGTGPTQGIKSFNLLFENERHIVNSTPHGDIGFDAYGNEVFVGYGDQSQWDADHSLFMVRLDGGGVTNLFPYVNGLGIWGGHISTRNINRPGWAYVSEHCCSNNPVAPRELFAIKLDNSGTIERYGKHHSSPTSYYHQAQLVPNRDGTKLMFASNWDDSNVTNQNSPPAFVLEYPQINVGLTVDAGNDRQICAGTSVTLNATGTGGTNYSWSNGETGSSITVSPNTTETYTVTLTDDDGNSVTDDVTINVNPIPVANAGMDATINEGESIVLTASGGSSYLWSTGEMSQSITINPIETTTYSVVVEENGCTSEPDEVVVTVIPTPIEADAGIDVSICNGESTILTASGGSNYVWSTGETSQSITVNPQSTTTYSVTVSEGSVSDTDSVTVTVNPIPEANAGNDISINEGESTTLTASGGSAFEWSTGETTQSITVNPSETTTYSVIVTENGCTSEPNEVVVTVIPTPIEADAGTDVSICNGESTILTASGGSNYVWSTGETSQSITVNPQSTTTYSVTVSEGSVSDTDSVTVTVNPIPEANAGNDISINEGESTTLTASGGSAFEWSTGETTQSITVNPSETTTYSVIVTENGCISESDSVTVTVIPSVIVIADAGDDITICQYDEVILTASGGSNYVWSTGETTQSITVSPLNTTTYSVTVIEGNVSDTDSVTVTVNPLAVAYAGEDETIELGEEVTLTAEGGNSFLWSNGSTNQQITVSPTETSNYSVTVFIGQCSDTDSVQVIVLQPLNVSAGEDTEICNGESVTLTANGGTDYIWSTGETTQSITVNPEISTEYSVEVSSGNQSASASVLVTVNNCQVEQDEPLNSEINVYPNPAQSELNLKVTGYLAATSIKIYDMQGRQLINQDIKNAETEIMRKTIDVSHLPRGIFVLTMDNNGESFTKQIILN